MSAKSGKGKKGKMASKSRGTSRLAGGADAALKVLPSGKQGLSAQERAKLEKIARELERRLRGEMSAKERRECLAMLRAVQKRLADSVAQDASTARLRRRTPAAPPRPGRSAKKAAKKAAKAKAKSKALPKASKPKASKPKAAKSEATGPSASKKAATKKPSALPEIEFHSFVEGGRDAFPGPSFEALPGAPSVLTPSAPAPTSTRRGRIPAPGAAPVRHTSRARPPMGGGPLNEAAPAAKPATAKIRRTPHIDIPPEPLQPGSTFEVRVYVDQKSARAGEDTIDVVAESGSQVEVQLVVSEHFSVNGSAMTQMTVTDATRSDADRPFSVSILPAGELPANVVPSLIALFFYKGRPSGKVSRAVQIVGVTTQALAPIQHRLELSDGVAADLTIVVTGAEVNDGRQFFCTVRSPWLEKYKVGVTTPWNLPEATDGIVLSLMDRFTSDATTPSMLLAELRGAGRQLYDASPKVFQQALWDLIDAGHAIKTIAIVTQEPFIPWELMTPYRTKDGRRQLREALGAEFLIGRWPTTDGISPSQKIPLRDSFVIAPRYTPPLSFALSEVKLVSDSFAGELIEPAVFDRIEQKLGSRGKTLVHFVCHGQDEETETEAIKSEDAQKRTRNRVQIIRLENGQTLNSTQILGMSGVDTIFEEKHPFIFLNACEIGRATPALIGIGGFAKSFIDLGASAVVAPLWSVKDTIAQEIAKVFYQRLIAEPNTPFAEILRDLRRKAYTPGQAEDTYAAYCFYGDPAAIRASDG
jgi:hypothetical protein